MNVYDPPWDGTFACDRFVRRILWTGPPRLLGIARATDTCAARRSRASGVCDDVTT